MTLSFPLTLTDRFALIMRALREAVAARIRFPPVTGAIILYVCGRFRKITVDFERLAARIRAGTYVERPAGRLRRSGGAGARPDLQGSTLHYRLGLPPCRFAWLHWIAPGDAGAWAEAMRKLISEPEMAAILAAVPRAGEILRPLCFMLGIEASLLRPAPPAPALTVGEGVPKPVPPTVPGAAAAAPVLESGTPRMTTGHDSGPRGQIFEPA